MTHIYIPRIPPPRQDVWAVMKRGAMALIAGMGCGVFIISFGCGCTGLGAALRAAMGG